MSQKKDFICVWWLMFYKMLCKYSIVSICWFLFFVFFFNFSGSWKLRHFETFDHIFCGSSGWFVTILSDISWVDCCIREASHFTWHFTVLGQQTPQHPVPHKCKPWKLARIMQWHAVWTSFPKTHIIVECFSAVESCRSDHMMYVELNQLLQYCVWCQTARISPEPLQPVC